MVRDKQILAKLFQFHPEFREIFQGESWLHLEEDGNVRVHRAFSAYSHFIASKLQRGTLENAAEIFSFVERVITHGAHHAAHAATTCFLENLMNRVPREIAPEKFVPLLGPESRRFCRKWDAVTGYRTKGLW